MRTQPECAQQMTFLRGIPSFLLLGITLSCLTISCIPSGPEVESGSTRLLTRRALGGGRCGGAWAILESDGQTVVFASPKKQASPTTGVCDLYTMKIDGTGRKQLTFGTDYDGQPVLAPDGKTIAFISERDGPSKVYLLNADGTGLRRLTQGDFNDSSPVFARDCSKVFFTRCLSDNPDDSLHDEVFSIGTDGLNEQRLTNNVLTDAPVAGSSNADMLYYLSGDADKQWDLFKLDLGKGISQKVLSLELRSDRGCDVSPDEQWITYVSDPEEPFEYDVFVCRMDGSNRRRLTNFHGYIGQVRFTPDGEQVMFVAEPRQAPEGGRGDIYIASVDGKLLRKIGTNWSPAPSEKSVRR